MPFHRGKQWLVEHLTQLLGVSLSGERVVVRGGLSWSLDPADYVCRDLFWCGAKDVAQLRVVCRHMRPGGVMLDVGANFGYYAITVAQALRQQCIVHAIEPNPVSFARLTGNLERNRIACVRPHRVGLWDADSTAQVTTVRGDTGSAYLTAGGDVPLWSLDEFCRRHDVRRLDLIKIDAEGSEWRVLRGGAQAIAAFRPVILAELNRQALARAGVSVDDVLDLFAQYRYSVAPVGFRRRRIDLHNLGDACADVLCTPTA